MKCPLVREVMLVSLLYRLIPTPHDVPTNSCHVFLSSQHYQKDLTVLQVGVAVGVGVGLSNILQAPSFGTQPPFVSEENGHQRRIMRGQRPGIGRGSAWVEPTSPWPQAPGCPPSGWLLRFPHGHSQI